MVEWKKLSLALALAAIVAPLASPGARADDIGNCTHKIIIPDRDLSDNVRIAVFLKTPGEELTAYTGKKGENKADVKVGNSYPTFTNSKKKNLEASAENVGTPDDLRQARGVAVLNSQRDTMGGFKLYIHLEHPDGRKGVCTIDADQKPDRFNDALNAELSRLKCQGTKSSTKMRINSCQARDLIQPNGIRVGYWGDVEFVD